MIYATPNFNAKLRFLQSVQRLEGQKNLGGIRVGLYLLYLDITCLAYSANDTWPATLRQPGPFLLCSFTAGGEVLGAGGEVTSGGDMTLCQTCSGPNVVGIARRQSLNRHNTDPVHLCVKLQSVQVGHWYRSRS